MSLQIYTDNKQPKQCIKLISESDQQILDYIEELKKCGYEIVDYPPLEYFRRMFNVNIYVTPPEASE